MTCCGPLNILLISRHEVLHELPTTLRQSQNSPGTETPRPSRPDRRPGTLETLLVELYNELLGQSPPARQKQLVEAQEQVGGGQPLNKLTLGKLVGVYRASRAGEDLVKTLGYQLTYLNPNALAPLVDIRNKAVHAGAEPDPAQGRLHRHQVELILRETNRLPLPISQSTNLPPTSSWWQIATHATSAKAASTSKSSPSTWPRLRPAKPAAEYQDPDTFFRRTFLTRGLRSTLAGVLRRLANKDDGVTFAHGDGVRRR